MTEPVNEGMGLPRSGASAELVQKGLGIFAS
jgi:hypothetical protein